VRSGRACGLYQRAKERGGQRVVLHALRVPLYADNPMFMWFVLYGFDHSIGGDRSDAQALTQIPDGLVMRRIDLDVESAVLVREAGNGRELRDFTSRLYPRSMDGIYCIRRKAFPAVFDISVEFAGDVLIQGTA